MPMNRLWSSRLRHVRIPTARELYTATPVDSAELQEILETQFFSSIRLKNGTYKFTYSRRLDDLNELTRKVIPPNRPLEVMDVAVSSGVSTLEWIADLNSAGIEHRMTAGDLTMTALLLSFGNNLH